MSGRPHFLQDFAESTGYVPDSILAVPLISGDRVIGVMEVLDKINAPSFGMQDMELLGVFAHQAALAISQAQQHEAIGEALTRGLAQLLGQTAGSTSGTLEQALESADGWDENIRRDLLELAVYFHEISAMGESERQMCLHNMATFRDYLTARPGFHRPRTSRQ